MADITHDNLTVAGRHIPDVGSGPFQNMQEAQAAGYDTLEPLTGVYQLGVVIDGAFVPFLTEKASYVFDTISAQQKQQQQQADQQAQSQPQSDVQQG